MLWLGGEVVVAWSPLYRGWMLESFQGNPETRRMLQVDVALSASDLGSFWHACRHMAPLGRFDKFSVDLMLDLWKIIIVGHAQILTRSDI